MSSIKKILKFHSCWSYSRRHILANSHSSFNRNSNSNGLQMHNWSGLFSGVPVAAAAAAKDIACSRRDYGSGYARNQYKIDDRNEAPRTNKRLDQIILNFPSLELIVKPTLGISRNQIEDFCRENRLRLNGKLLKQTKLDLKKGDVFEIVKGFSATDPTKLLISRIEILDVSTSGRRGVAAVATRRCKALLVDNYPDENAWKV